MTDVNLDELRTKVTSLGEKVKTLKTSSDADKDAITKAVKDLLDAKRTFAQNNNGIGVDGKPFEEPMTKAEKKAKAKAEKAAKAAAEGGGGGEKKEVQNSENAAKKAAKKAEAKAKKAALKAAGGGKANTPSSSSAAAKAAPTKAKPSFIPMGSVNALKPLEIAFNPNAPLAQRPVTALAVAVMTNTAPDLTITSDHKRMNPALGTIEKRDVIGDLAMARYLIRQSSTVESVSTTNKNSNKMSMIGTTFVEMAEVDQWADYASAMMRGVDAASKSKAMIATLDRALVSRTYLVGQSLTLADLAVYTACGWPSQHASPIATSSTTPQEKETMALAKRTNGAAYRWLSMMSCHPAIQEATQLAVGIVSNAEARFASDGGDELDAIVPGMNALEGGTPGNVVTRFPPEPSGYLHIGHAKACLLNDYYARRYKGRLIVRFDDTNPSKEKEEYQMAIIEDLQKLGIKPDVVTFTSDYLGVIQGMAEQMIDCGMAFMDDTPQEEMQAERMERKESKHRNQSLEEAKKLFSEMCSGSEEGGKWCLRARIDMGSVNGTMRDPVLYRQNLTPHHRSGTTFKAYPTYDLACPIVDSLEGVTHALRTTEYNDRDEQYAWIQTCLNLRRVRIHSFARMNFMYTELSKRKLTWFVENNIVTGWDDARFPTIRGVVRRGININALRGFILGQGASRRVTLMEWSKFWAENKKEIDKTAKRFMAVHDEEHVKLSITNAPKADEFGYVTADFHPKDPSMGKRVLRLSNEVLLEKVDTEGLVVGENIVLMRWGVVNITKIDGGLEGTYIPSGDVKAAKRKLSWMANVQENTPCILTEFDNLISKEKLEEGENFKDFINPNTMATSNAIGDAGLKMLQQHEVIQLERRGYYRVDRPYVSESKPLVLFMIPDGKAKAMSGLTGKLAHR